MKEKNEKAVIISLTSEFNKLKEDMKKQLESEILKKYNILSKAYKIGKILYGNKFSVFSLSKEFDIPYTTTKRLLSLDRMTPKTKKLLKEGKISAARVAQICSTKNIHFQEELVDLVIEKDLTSQDLKKIKVNKMRDIKNI